MWGRLIDLYADSHSYVLFHAAFAAAFGDALKDVDLKQTGTR